MEITYPLHWQHIPLATFLPTGPPGSPLVEVIEQQLNREAIELANIDGSYSVVVWPGSCSLRFQ